MSSGHGVLAGPQGDTSLVPSLPEGSAGPALAAPSPQALRFVSPLFWGRCFEPLLSSLPSPPAPHFEALESWRRWNHLEDVHFVSAPSDPRPCLWPLSAGLPTPLGSLPCCSLILWSNGELDSGGPPHALAPASEIAPCTRVHTSCEFCCLFCNSQEPLFWFSLNSHSLLTPLPSGLVPPPTPGHGDTGP